MRFEDVLVRSERSELSQMEAAELLGISERTFRRWRARHREDGERGCRTGGWVRRPGGLRWRRSHACWVCIVTFTGASR
jgi:transposase